MARQIVKPTCRLVLPALIITILAPIAAFAGAGDREDTALGLPAATLFALTRHNTTSTLVLGAATAYAWKRYHDAGHRDAYMRGHRMGLNRGVRCGRYRVYRRHPGYRRYYLRPRYFRHYVPCR